MAEGSRTEALERENGELRRAVTLLHGIANLVRESLELEPACYAVLTGVTAGVGLGFNRAMLFLVDDARRDLLRGLMGVGPSDGVEADRTWRSIEAEGPDLTTLYEAALSRREAPAGLDRWVRDTSVAVAGDSPVALALRTASPVRGSGGDDLGGLLDLPTAVAAPLRGRDAIAGVLYADNRFTGRRPDAVAEHIFALVADHAGRAVENARRYERVARAARTDSLTGLGHHGALMEALQRAVAQARASEAPLSIAMIDLDDFKAVNDIHGHLAGDALLAGLASRLRGELRAGETPFRYGGEEFTVLLPGVGPEGAMAAGERIRRAVGGRPFPLGELHRLSITASVGVASLGDQMDGRALVEAADAALLAAKSAGKDQVARAPSA